MCIAVLCCVVLCCVVLCCVDRFGKVVKVVTPSEDASHALRVEFASRRDAEMAIKRAGHFSGQTVNMAFDEPSGAPVVPSASGGGGGSAPSGGVSEGRRCAER
jgi:hypothetical protein